MQTMAPPEDAMKERFARIDERFDRTDEKILDVDRRVSETAKATDRRLKEVDRRISEVDRRISEVDRRITETSASTNKRLENVESEVAGLNQGMKSLHVDIHRATIALWVGSAGVVAAILAKGG
ncbi:MAG: hypothetical protein ACJ76B_12085 [Solirubrobacterales bacterium]